MAGKERLRERAEGERPPVSLQFAATLVHARTSECDLAAGEGADDDDAYLVRRRRRREKEDDHDLLILIVVWHPSRVRSNNPHTLPRSRALFNLEQESKC